MKTLPLLTLLALGLQSVNLRAESLASYTKELSLPALAPEAHERLRELLAVQNHDVSALKKVAAEGVGASLPRKKHVSSFVRRHLVIKAKEFMLKDLYDTPQLFEPSSTLTMAQVDIKVADKTVAFCKEKVAPDFDILIKLYEAETDNSFLESAVSRVDISGVGIAVRDYLKGIYPEGTHALGKLAGVEVEEGGISRLVFIKDNKLTKISLAMLASVRSGEDFYFVQMVACFDALVSQKLGELMEQIKKGKSNDFALRDRLQEISHGLNDRVAKSVEVSQALSVLPKQDLHNLINIFLVYNQNAYVASDNWDLLKLKLIEKISTVENDDEKVKSIQRDLNFFQENLDAIDLLNETLESEQAKATFQKETK